MWVSAKGHPKYEVSNWGSVRFKRNGHSARLLRNTSTESWLVNLNLSIAKLVAYHFCPRPKAWGDHVYVKHLDGNLGNASASNLYVLPLRGPGEVWKSSLVVNNDVRQLTYYISNKGRLRSNYRRRPLTL